MPVGNRKIHKFVSTVQFTVTGQAAIDLPGIKRVEYSGTARTNQTQVGNATRPDHTIVLGIDDTINLVTEDADILDLSTYLAGMTGTLTWKNVVASTAATQRTYTAANLTCTSVGLPMAAGEGPHELSINFISHATDGSTSPVTRA